MTSLVAALLESMKKRHDYGRQIVKLTYSPPSVTSITGLEDWEDYSSHTNPIDECESPGCVKSREALHPYRNIEVKG